MNVPTSFIKTRGNCGELGVNLISLPNRARGYLYCSSKAWRKQNSFTNSWWNAI